LTSGNFYPLAWLTIDKQHPPFYTISAVPFFAIFHNEDGAVLVNFVYYFILVTAAYLVVRELTQDRELSLIASFLAGLTPPILQLELHFMPDLPLASLVTLSIYFLLKSKRFTDKRNTVLFGLTFGLAALTKWIAFVFILPPALYLLAIYLKKSYKNKENLKHLSKNVAYAFVAFLIVALPWYLINLQTVIASLFYSGVEVSDNLNLLSLPSVAFYPSILLVQAIVDYSILVASIFLLFFVYKKEKFDDKLVVILIWIFASLFILTFILRNKKGSDILPVYPAIVILFAYTLSKLKLGVKTRKALSWGVVVVSLISCVFAVPKPLHQNWHANDIILAIAKDVVNNPVLVYNDGKIIIAELQPCPYINGRTLQYYALKNEYPFVVLNIEDVSRIMYFNDTRMRMLYSTFDYVVYKTGAYKTPQKFVVDRAVKFFDEREKMHYVKIAEYELPDKSRVIIYRRKT